LKGTEWEKDVRRGREGEKWIAISYEILNTTLVPANMYYLVIMIIMNNIVLLGLPRIASQAVQ